MHMFFLFTLQFKNRKRVQTKYYFNTVVQFKSLVLLSLRLTFVSVKQKSFLQKFIYDHLSPTCRIILLQ